MEETKTKSSKHYLGFLLKLLLTLAAFYLVWRQVNWQEFIAALSSQKAGWVMTAVAIVMVQIVCGGIRWHQLLSALTQRHFSPFRITCLYYASLVFNVFIPGTLGSDVSRIWMARSEHIPPAQLIYSVVMDRIFSLLGLLVLMIVLIPFFFEHIGLAKHLGVALALAAVIGFLAGLWLLLYMLPRIQQSQRLRFLKRISEPLLMLIKHPAQTLSAFAISLASQLLACTVFYVLALSLALPVDYFDFLVLIPAVMFISALPLSINGLGVRELGTTSSLALIGVAPAHAVLIALQVSLIGTALSASGGIMYLLEKRKK